MIGRRRMTFRRRDASGFGSVTARARAPSHLALAVVAALVAGCGGSGDDPSPTPPKAAESPAPTASANLTPASPQDEVLTLMHAREDALEAGDVAGYAATAAGAQRARDRRAARRAARLPLRNVVLDAEVVDERANRLTLAVDEAYSIAGVRSTYQSRRRVIARRTEDGWRISTVRGARGRPPWELAPFTARRTRHFVVLAPPRTPVGPLLQDLETGYRRMRTLLTGSQLRRRYLVLVAAGPDQAHALTSNIRGVETLTAIADAAIREAQPALAVTDVISLRLLVNWGRFAALDAAGRSRVITHELTHAALAGETSGRTPAWLVEGVAMYVSADRRLPPANANLAELSRPDAIGRLSGADQAAGYATSSAAAFALAERYGRRRLLALYDAFNDRKLRGAPGPRLVNRALRRELGITIGELEAALG
jgi:hypothetical protein